MLNVKQTIKGNKLILEVDLSQTHGASSSGKSITVASTKGNKDTGFEGVKFGLNVYKPV